jgi:hypothetical protein
MEHAGEAVRDEYLEPESEDSEDLDAVVEEEQEIPPFSDEDVENGTLE